MIVTFCDAPLLKVIVEGLTDTAPIPVGSVPGTVASGPPSTLSDTVPPKYVPLLFGVLMLTDVVPVPPVAGMRTAVPPLIEKSRLTLPIEIPTG